MMTIHSKDTRNDSFINEQSLMSEKHHYLWHIVLIVMEDRDIAEYTPEGEKQRKQKPAMTSHLPFLSNWSW